MIKSLLLVGIGSFTGGVARHLLSRLAQHPAVGLFPIGTLLVNIVGCLIVGILYGLTERGGLPGGEWRLLLITGFCGGFTTFSTFMHENFSLMDSGHFFHVLLYTALSLLLGLTAAWLGHLLVRLY